MICKFDGKVVKSKGTKFRLFSRDFLQKLEFLITFLREQENGCETKVKHLCTCTNVDNDIMIPCGVLSGVILSFMSRNFNHPC